MEDCIYRYTVIIIIIINLFIKAFRNNYKVNYWKTLPKRNHKKQEI
jgi:hypothetical protein